MTTEEIEIPANEWSEFCASFVRANRGSLVTLRTLSDAALPDGRAPREGRVFLSDHPLQALETTRTGGAVRLVVGIGDAHERYGISLPNVARLYGRLESGAHRGIRVDSADGTSMLVQLRSAARTEAPKGK